jgi:hypothetical protein
MVTEQELVELLHKHFAYVQKYWNSGNFVGYAASDNPDVVNAFVQQMH